MVGQHIGKYRVTQQVGRGGMGTVYCATDETLHREVAVKVLNAGLNDPTVGRRFRAEAVTVARLNHPGIATIYELVQHDGQWLMVMEYVRGETLEHVVAQNGPLPVERAADIVMQMLAALAHAHSLGVVHRDLKPANLMLTAGGGVKVMDFGIARVAGAEHLTTAGFMMGTPAYMAPEQVTGSDVDARADLYAAGLIFYHLVTGQLPFSGDTPFLLAQARVQDAPTPIRTVRGDLPEWVEEVIARALALAPDDRFQTALAFREAIRRGLSNLPIEAPASAALPPELVMTAEPGSLRVGTSQAPGPKPTAPPAAVTPTVGSIAAGSGDVSAGAGGAGLARRPPVAIVAALLIAAAFGGWWVLRSDPVPPAAPALEAPAIGAASTDPTPQADDEAGPASDAPATAETAAAANAASASPPETPPAEAPATPPPAAPAAPGSEGSVGAGASGGSSSATTAGTAGDSAPAPAASTGRTAIPPAPADGPAVFRNVRAFVVTGRRVDERDAVLAFADGEARLADSGGGTTYASLPFTQITSAAHIRARNPKWFPTLAGPAADIDMPGGLFRGDRHWLVLQSRTGYLIARIDDDDWRRVAQAVTDHLGLTVAEIAR